MELQVDSIYCVYLKYAYNMMRCLYNRFRFPAVPVTKVRQTLLRCVDRRKNTSERREKEVQVSLDLPNAAWIPVPISVLIPIAVLIATAVLIITVVAAMITIAAAIVVVLISFGLIIAVLGGHSY